MSKRTHDFLKRSLDILGALAGLAVLAVLFVPIAVAIKINSRGPVIFEQERLTRGRRIFRFYKFRTMAMGQKLSRDEMDRINEMGGAHFKSRFDPRITRVGAFLRKFSLDELPQFFNVFVGDMSMVGPRPPLKHEVAQYEPWQMRRLSVRTGLTGLWQVSGRSHVDFYRMIEMDIEYVDHPSIWLDLKIMLKTVPTVLFGKGAW